MNNRKAPKRPIYFDFSPREILHKRMAALTWTCKVQHAHGECRRPITHSVTMYDRTLLMCSKCKDVVAKISKYCPDYTGPIEITEV